MTDTYGVYGSYDQIEIEKEVTMKTSEVLDLIDEYYKTSALLEAKIKELEVILKHSGEKE